MGAMLCDPLFGMPQESHIHTTPHSAWSSALLTSSGSHVGCGERPNRLEPISIGFTVCWNIIKQTRCATHKYNHYSFILDRSQQFKPPHSSVYDSRKCAKMCIQTAFLTKTHNIPWSSSSRNPGVSSLFLSSFHFRCL